MAWTRLEKIGLCDMGEVFTLQYSCACTYIQDPVQVQLKFCVMKL